MKLLGTSLALVLAALALGACSNGGGSQEDKVASDSQYRRGSELFLTHCSGCHTLSEVGANGSATSVGNRLKTNGPNFNIRKENEQQVLYAIRNGGFSGAIMPENILVGQDAEEVAKFLAAYSGRETKSVPTTNIQLGEK